MTQNLAPQLLRLPPEEWAAKTTISKGPWGLCLQNPLDDSKQETVLNGLMRTHCGSPLQGSAQREQTEMPISQSFSKEVYLQKLLSGGQDSNLAYICDSTQRQGGWQVLSPHMPSGLLRVIGVSLEGACAYI